MEEAVIMAKTKVSELAEELGIDKKEVLDFLHKKNVDAKIGSSSVDDDAAAMVRGALGKSDAKPKTAKKTENKKAESGAEASKKTEKTEKAEKKADTKKVEADAEASKKTEKTEKTEKKADSKPAESAAEPSKKSESKQSDGQSNAGGAAGESAELPKKKKKIIMVTNNSNSHFGGEGQRRQNNYQNERPAYNNNNGSGRNGSYNNSYGGSGRGYSQPHQFIRPTQKPKPVDEEPYDVRQRREQERHEQDLHRHDAEVKEQAANNVNSAVKTDASANVSAVNNASANTTANATVNNSAVENKTANVSATGNATQRQTSSGQTDRNAGSGHTDPRYSQGQRSYNSDRSQQGQGSYQGRSSQGQNGSYSQNRTGGSGYGQNRTGGSGYSQNRTGGSGYSQNRTGGSGYSQNRTGGSGYSQNRTGGSGYSQNRPSGGGYGQNRTGGSSYGQNRPNNGGGYGNRPQGGRYESQDQRGGSYGAGGGRSYGGGGRNFGNNAGPGNRFGKSSAPSSGSQFTSAKDNEKRRDEEKRRNAQQRDHGSKRDLIYEDEEKLKSRPGRFIKPEKKEEVVEEEKIKVISIPEKINIRDLADKMKLQPSVIIKKLFLDGQVVTMNTELAFEDAENIAADYDILCEKLEEKDIIKELLKEEDDDESTLIKRPPVVCVMGHVDHGKTSLLDAIRKTSVTSQEAGGITQAIGAYTVTAKGQPITFLDTPGHEAFTAMRMRGAQSTDIAVLVVAADDGVMPQTVEAISHAKAAGIEIIVAVNKIDKPNANIERVKQELTEYELVSTDWGGTTEFVPVSAKTGQGIDSLLETILLTADILELKANPNRMARGLVIEAKLDKGRGPVATVLVQKGTLHVGSFVSAGASYGKVRAMIDDKGKNINDASPSIPVEILGLGEVPEAGETFIAHENEKSAKNFANTYRNQHKADMIAESKSRMSMDDVFARVKEGTLKELDLIVKADVQGSVEALKQSLAKLSNDEVAVKCIHGGVGAINESDVILASASNAIIIGFNVRPDGQAKATADRENVEIKLYSVIYKAIDDVELALKGMLAPVYEEKVIGHAEVRQIFKASAIGNIAGSFVTDGMFQRDCLIRITRDGEQIYEGKLASLKRFKDDAKEVKEGYECGLVFDGFDKMQELDQVEAYIMAEVPRK